MNHYCENCANEIPEGLDACPDCGTPVIPDEPVKKNTYSKAPIVATLFICIIVFAVLFGKYSLQEKTEHVYIPEPVQINMMMPQTIAVSGKKGDVKVILMAEYTVEGIVKGKKKYSDYQSQISTYDFALAWGDLNTKDIDEHISYSQSGRWYYYRYPDCPVNGDYISDHSANVHLIHSDSSVLTMLKDINKGDYVRLEGYLVNVIFEDYTWRSSLVRTDTGGGSCEVMYVTAAEVIGE